MKKLAAALLLPLSVQAWAQTPEEIRGIAQKAYAFAYPLVLMETTRRAAVAPGLENRFAHARQFPDARFHQVIRPNADTLYSSAWLDLSTEPVLLHVGDTGGRYYLMQLMDAWTETISAPGKRTTGTGEGWFAIVGPGWKGTLPDKVQRVDCPTNMAWLLGRTQTNGAADYPAVRALQDGYTLMPLSRYPDGPGPVKQPAANPVAPAAGRPPERVAKMNATEFFTMFADLLVQNPPHSGDGAMMAQLKEIGIVPGKFDPSALGAAGLKAIEDGAAAGSAQLNSVGGWSGTPGPTGWSAGSKFVGRYGTNYAARAVVARVGLGANPPEDAVYLNSVQDGDGQPFRGSRNYRIHFEKGRMPPVKAFWSITMYDPQGYFAANAMGRYAIGDRDALKFNADGSLDIYVGRASPGAEKESNWLPAPADGFNLTFRLYWPEDAILDGRWTPPAVVAEK